MTIDSRTSQCVETPDLEEAMDLLEDRGQVVLCGPPGCGKTTLAFDLLRKCREDGFTPHIISKLEKLDSANIETNVASELTVFLLDGTLGRVRVDRQQYDLWREKRPGLMELVDQGRCRLVISLYTHVLREARELESGVASPLTDRSLVVQVGNSMSSDLKEQMLNFHLKKLQLDPVEHSRLVQTILQTDRSGRGFPWCCHHLMTLWSSSRDPAIFSAPEETHALLLKEMVTSVTHFRLFAAVLALIMRGFHNLLHTQQQVAPSTSLTWLVGMLTFQSQSTNHPQQAQLELIRLGFDAFSNDQLAEYADILRGSILTEDGKGFANRVQYDAAALALGRSFRLPTMLRACDAMFVVQHVHATQVIEWLNEGREIKWRIIVGLPTCCSMSRPIQTTSVDFQSLLEKIVNEIMSGHLPEISQHPSLQCPEFLLVLEQYCQTHDLSVQQLVSVVDPVHGLPLVYWSVFSRSDTLTQWCLTHMTQTQSGLKLLSASVLLAFAVFDQLVGNSTCRLQPLMQGVLSSKYFSFQTGVVELPLLGRERCLTQETLQHYHFATDPEASDRQLYYLLDSELPISDSVIKVQVSEEKMTVQVGYRGQWYMVHRILADREVDWRDQEGNTLLHLALNSGDSDIIQLAMKSGSSLLQKNSQGQTAYQVAQKRRGALWRASDSNTADYLTAIRDGDEVKVKTMLCKTVGVQDKNSSGDTGLHVACKAGHRNIAELLIRLDADVNIKNRSSFTALHLACFLGHTHMATLLTQNRADVNIQSEYGETALHLACQCTSQTASVDVSRLLLDAGAGVNMLDMYGAAPLHYAAVNGHVDTADHLISHGAEINTQDFYGDTPLHGTVQRGHTHTAQSLIHHGADTNLQSQNGVTPLHEAIRKGHTDIVEQLVCHGSDTNVKDRRGNTPLHDAVTQGLTNAAGLMIRYGADINMQEHLYGNTPLHLAVKQADVGAGELLISLGANANIKNGASHTPLHFAYKSSNPGIVSLLIKGGAEVSLILQTVGCGDVDALGTLIQQGADVNEYDPSMECSPLHVACMMGHSDLVTCLLEHEAQVNAVDGESCTPLYQACQHSHTEIANYLIMHGAGVNICDQMKVTPLHRASAGGHTETALCLLQNGAHVNATDSDNLSKPLHKACENGHHQTALDLILNGASVNAEDHDDATPLHKACENGHYQTAMCLIKHGAGVNTVDSDLFTPLHKACRKGDHQTALSLIQHGASVDARTRIDHTPLHQAAWKGDHQTVACLLQHGANVNARDFIQDTPLHDACMFGHNQTALCLIQHGADLSARDEGQSTPLHKASERGHHQTALCLIQQGASVNAEDKDKSTPLHKASENGHHQTALCLIQQGANVNAAAWLWVKPLDMARKHQHRAVIQILIQHGATANWSKQ